MRRMRSGHLVTAACVALLLTTAASIAAAQGTVTGTVTAQGTGEPLAETRIVVVGTNLFATTGTDGKYLVRRVPVGTAEIRVIRVGYAAQKKSVAVLEGQMATLDFALGQTVVQLQEVVTTATGDQRRVEVGNAVENISVAKVVESSPIRGIADVLNGRVANVAVLSGTQTGTGQRVRVRGISSLALSNDPIYVIDGIRMSANNSSIGYSTLGNNPSRLGDLNPEEIENIEIVKGPSAATLYGTDAANGVVLITTKKGRAGAARWTIYAEGGLIDDRHHYSDNYTLAGHNPTTNAPLINSGQCTLPMVSAGTCAKDSVRIFNPIHDAETTPLGKGDRQEYGVQVSAGTDAIRYFLSAGRDDEVGVFKLPEFEARRYDSLGITPHPWTKRPNMSLKNNFRANINAAVNSQLDLGINFGYNNVDQRYSVESNGTAGIGSQAFGGPGYRNNGLVASVNTPLNGYRAWTPAYTWEERTGQRVNRMIFATNLSWRPSSWLSVRANVGTDFTDRVDNNLRMNGEAPPLTATYRGGFAGNNRTDIRNKTADVSATANYNPSRWRWMTFKTTVGSQYNDNRFDQSFAEGDQLPPGAQTASAGATPNALEGTTLQKTLGVYVEELLGLRDRLFLTGAVRSDQNSAFGTNFQRVFYPKGSISWVVSDESFFPHIPGLSSLRLRGAYGAAGVQPGPNDALRTYSATSASIKGTDLPVETFNALGNKDLKPERSTEFEGGFETRLFDRVQLDMTYYSRTTHDALINEIIAPSVGTGQTNKRSNLGSIKNAGVEMTIGGQVIDRSLFGLDLQLSASDNENKVVSLGNTPRQIGTSNWIVAGYPIRALWARPITGWQDKNGDGILTDSPDANLDEVFVSNDTIFRGYAQPRYMASLTTGIDLFKRRLRIQNLFDYRGGHLWYNNTERIRCVSRQNCNGLMNPNSSFEEQAMVQATLTDPSKTLDGFFQPGAFIRWREFSATAVIPERWIARTRARNASFVFSIRNVGIHTKYRGTDPESDFTASEGGDSPAEFQTFAAPMYLILRLNLGF